MVEEYVVRDDEIDLMHAMDVQQGPTCKECGARLELQGGNYTISLKPDAPSPGTRFWACPNCKRRPKERVAYDHVNNVLLVNLPGGE